MNIYRKKSFKKAYQKLTLKWQEKVDETLREFAQNPYNPKLSNHSLHGELKGLRAISVAGDIRIVFEEQDNYIVVILVTVGTHNQVY